MPEATTHHVIHGLDDPIRIVPRHDPHGLGEALPQAGAAAPPQLTYRGGPLMANVEVFTVFWGAAWKKGTTAKLTTYLDQFFKYVLTSPLIDQLGEYSVPAHKIGHGKYVGTTVITKPAPHKSTTDAAIQHMLQQEISTNSAFPQPSANMLYFVYLPPGVAVVQGGSKSCQAFCGYHDNISGTIFYAVMPYPGCQGCMGGLTAEQALTSTSSHELCEAITDPIPGSGWYDDVNGEIGDICAWQTRQLGQYTVQLEWSNKANSCM